MFTVGYVIATTELDSTRPKWEQIYQHVVTRIENGTYAVGSKLSEVELVEEFGVARETVRKATAQLREDGYIRTHHGMGSFILPRNEDQPDT